MNIVCCIEWNNPISELDKVAAKTIKLFTAVINNKLEIYTSVLALHLRPILGAYPCSVALLS